MEYLDLILKIMLVHAFGLASPGPDFFVVTRNALTYSRKIGIYTAIGVGVGISVHVIYGLGGIALLIEQNPSLFIAIRIAGSLYLIYLGIISIRSTSVHPVKDNPETEVVSAGLSVSAAFKTGFVTNVLNPKATMFFLSVFSVMIPSKTPISVLIIIGVMLIINTGLWFVLVATVFTQQRVRTAYLKYENIINIIFGIILILFAIKILFF